MADTVFELKDVSYAYLDRFAALKGVNVRVSSQEKVAILGANGSGKSTLLHILAGLIFPKDGEVFACGSRLTEERFRDQEFRKYFRSRVGVLFQNPDIQLFNSSVEDEVAFGLVQMDLAEKEIRARVDKYLILMGMAHAMTRHPQWLSAGEKKRVCLASVLAMEPEILLLDEPTAGLDPATTCHLIDSIVGNGARERTIITATHDLHIVHEIATRVIVLSEDKRVVRETTPSVLFSDTSFLEEHNLIHIHAHRHEDGVHVHRHGHYDHHH